MIERRINTKSRNFILEESNRIPYSDFILRYKTKSLYGMQNTLKRYKKRLLKEAFRKATKDDIEIVPYSLRINRKTEKIIFIYQDFDGNVDTNPLIDLVKKDLPSLYRKYNSMFDRYEKECQKLENMIS